ncbi:MAG TPA: Nramp family divalent metal transporter [Candidatus Saccharimonadales bacterium]|nr:Nramp family divalent metal transporter [Candidatus Saccharimonadales bacterium]
MTQKAFERVVGSPSVAIEKTLETSKHFTNSVFGHKHVKKATDYWHALGPGLTTGAADDDPSGIATYSQAGAQYGFSLLWLAAFTFPLMAVVQEMCARIGLVTGKGLAANIRRHYPKWVLYLCTILLFGANSLNIGADLGAMAKATQLLNPHLNFGFLLLAFTILCLALQIFTTYERYAKYLKWLALVLLSYVFSALSVNLDLTQLLKHSFLPTLSFSKDEIFIITGVLGTTISPYLFFWQTSQEVEEEILKGKTTEKMRLGTNEKDIKNMRTDVWSGMFLSNLVMFFIIAACAATLFAHGIRNINTTADAALALKPLAGDRAYLLFALGVIGTGLLAVPVLAGSASYAISESFGWQHGLYKKLKQANAFYGVIIISTLIGLAINFIGIDPIKALLISAVANGMIAPLVLTLIILISSSKKIMGNWANDLIISIIGWFVTIAMVIAGVATLFTLFVR